MEDRQGTPSEPTYGFAPAGFRLPPETRLGPISLQVADLERSLGYYGEMLGFRVAQAGPEEATLTANGDDRPLAMLRERSGAAPVPMRGRLGLYHFAVLLPTRGDLGRFLRHLAQAGERAGASDHHVSEALYLRDPDGHGIEVYADRPREVWETNGRELRMETEPMNTSDVLRAAGETRWGGMPFGTGIGHVHLHAGDLGAAEGFYHQALGFDKVVWSYPGALFLSAGGYHHHLGLNTWAGSDAQPAREDEARLLEWTLELPDDASVAAAGQSLDRAGYWTEAAPGGEVLTRDPSGTSLRLRAARGSIRSGSTGTRRGSSRPPGRPA